MAQAHALRVAIAILLASALAIGPVLPKVPVEIVLAQIEVPETRLMDVGIELFEAGLPEDDEHAEEDKGVFPEVRKSEARFLPFHLKNVLESTGQWGAVRVIPPGKIGVDLHVSGEILKSTGHELSVKIHAADAAGKVWRDARYTEEADPRAYQEDQVEFLDPYERLYNRIANDLLSARERFSDEYLQSLREISRLRFAADLAPEAFEKYLRVSKSGRVRIERLPSADDPMVSRIDEVRGRDDMFVDTLNEYYADFYARMGEPYDHWRHYSFEEQMELRAISRQARKRAILAGLLILGGAAASSSSAVGRAATAGAYTGGILAAQSAMEKSREGKIHKAALKELAASFDAEIESVLVDVAGQTLRLEGSAEAQYAEWRQLLSEIFATESGLPAEGEAENEPEVVGDLEN